MYSFEKALEVLEFEKSLANTETAEAIDTAIHCINIVSAIESPKLCVRDMGFDHPTAYDIDKVIEQLEENYSCDVGNLKMISLDKAIEIVKKGDAE